MTENHRRIPTPLLVALAALTAALLAGGCGSGGGRSIPKALMGDHDEESTESSVSISSDGGDSVALSSSDVSLTVDSTHFYSRSASRTASLSRSLRDGSSRESSDARLVINDRDSLDDLAALGGEVSIEATGFMPDAGDDGHVAVLVELSRPSDRIPAETLLPHASVTVGHDEASGHDSVTLSFGRVADPTAADDTPRLLRDAVSIVILRTR